MVAHRVEGVQRTLDTVPQHSKLLLKKELLAITVSNQEVITTLLIEESIFTLLYILASFVIDSLII